MLRPLDDFNLSDLLIDLARPEARGRGCRCHLGARHRVHVRADERALQLDVLGDVAAEVHRAGVAPLQDAELWREQEIVEGAARNNLLQTPSHQLIANTTRRCRACHRACRFLTWAHDRHHYKRRRRRRASLAQWLQRETA